MSHFTYGTNKSNNSYLFLARRIKRFGRNRNMWEDKGKQNTPNGIKPKRHIVKIKTVSPDDDRLPPSHMVASPGSDIIARKGFVGNTKFLKGIKKRPKFGYSLPDV